MRSRGRGGIVLMGSLAGCSGSPGFALYGASTAYSSNLSEALWFEPKQHGVHVLCPIAGPTNTPTMVESYGPLDGHAADPAFIVENALDRVDQGPIWGADDIREGVEALLAMAPAERATYTAQMAAEFAGTP
jgi:short-subunit dehydrogenase